MKKIIAMGNALVDIMTNIENDDILAQLEFPKGSMQLVDARLSEQIQKYNERFKHVRVSGGSAANTIRSLANLGSDCGYLGKIGTDDLGNFFRNEMISLRIKTHLLNSSTATGLAVAFISPDSERTFATYLGAASEMTAEELNESFFDEYNYLHIEGYLAFNHSLLERALEIAHSKQIIISMDMASYNVVEINHDFLLQIIRKYVDIVFANEEEAKALTGKSPEEALNEISEWCNIAVVKTGAEGSLVRSNGVTISVPARKTNPVDTTGAGDNYAAGFLYGLSNMWDLKKCGQLGTIMASRVIEVIGTTMSSETWKWISEEKERIEKGI